VKRALAVCLLLAGLVAGAGAQATGPVAPAVTEPSFDGQVISPYDVHMVAGPFVGPPGAVHICSDWEIQTASTSTAVWTASCVTGALAVHIHLGDGTFAGALAGHHQLDADTPYNLRVRFKDGALAPADPWSPWSTRAFLTGSASVVEPLVLSDVSRVPDPRWQDAANKDLALPEGITLRLELPGAGPLLEFHGPGSADEPVVNPPALDAHGTVRVVCEAGPAPVDLPASRVTFTDGSGTDRQIYLPAIALASGSSVAFWISEAGEAFPADAANAAETAPATFPADALTASPIPWAVKQPGFVIEPVATGFQLPVNVAFLPNPGAGPDDPFFYVTELYGKVRLVTRSGAVSDYATGLLNFDPVGSFPGSGEKGLTGIAVEPVTGDVFVGAVEAVDGVTDSHFPRVIRLHSTDGGRTSSSRTTVLDFPAEPLGASHQISNVSIGPDGKLYVHIGDGLFTTPALDMNSVRGKILRSNLDGSAPTDNPFYDAADGMTATDLIFALGLRNPFGGAWRAADGAQWEVENGPSIDRLAKLVAGRNYLWDGTDASMKNFAAYNWPISMAPVNIAFVQPTTFSGSEFPADRQDHAYVTESGPTYAPGPQGLGKRVSEFVLDAQGALVSGPVPLIEYVGAGRGTASALAAGPDGLYFSDLYKDFGAVTPIDAGASVFRIRYVGIADFSANVASGMEPLTVQFQDASDVPGASAWHWEFGDGATSDEHNPSHQYVGSGSFDVRLTVTGRAGAVARQKAAMVAVESPARQASPCCRPLRPIPRAVPPRGVRP
jgi:glucose/arabinose dehydrogenase